jgi:hypothetical protein
LKSITFKVIGDDHRYLSDDDVVEEDLIVLFTDEEYPKMQAYAERIMNAP